MDFYTMTPKQRVDAAIGISLAALLIVGPAIQHWIGG
jgi:hypothetical protein